MSALVRRDGDEGKRDYLDGRGVHCGDTLEVRLASGRWERVRYEVEPKLDGGPVGVLYLALPGTGEGYETTAVIGAAFVDLRWPVSS